MLLIVGLGNPGAKYTNTHHNVGFRVIDALAAERGIALTEEKRFSAWTGRDTAWLLAKPTTFMNRSGEAVQKILAFLKIPPEDLVVIHDDFNLQFGEVRFKEAAEESGDGGHKGVRSIIQALGTSAFNRIKIGIKNWGENPRPDAERFVLEPFAKEEEENLPTIIESALALLHNQFKL